MKRAILLLVLLLQLPLLAQPDPPTSSEQEAGFLFRQGLKLLEEGQPDRATDLLKRALRLEPERLEIRPYLARSLYEQRDYESALRQLDLYLNAEPTDAKVGLFRVRVLVALENFGQAADALAFQREAHRHKSWEWHNLQGFFLQRAQELESAEAEYKIAAELAPKSEYEPRSNLMILWLSQERFEEATALVSQMLDESAGDPQVLNAFALLLSKKEPGFDPAPLLDAVKNKSLPLELQYNLAAALAERGETTQAALLAADLVDRFPDSAQAMWIYGRVLLQQRELQDAGEYLLASVDKLPADKERLNTMGFYSYLVGDFPEAVNWYRQALEKDETDPDTAHNLSLALSRSDKLEEAAEASRKAVLLNGEDPRFVYQLALVLDRDGKLGEAAEYYRVFLTLNQDVEQAAIVREHLEELEGPR